jgi:hypothetical protein
MMIDDSDDDSTRPLGISKAKNASSQGDHFARIRIPKGQELRSGERKERFLQTAFGNLTFHEFL